MSHNILTNSLHNPISNLECQNIISLTDILNNMHNDVYFIGQGGQIGGQGGQGGAMGGGGGFYPNGNDNRIPNRNPNFWNDPSNRREITLTVEFTVVDPDEAGDTEEHDPRIEAVYAAKEKSDTCREVSSSICGDKWWWVMFTTWDSGSGIRKIDMDKSRQTNGGRPDFDRNQDDIVYYRCDIKLRLYINFLCTV